VYNLKVIALLGKSGTGKSHKALLVARDNDAELIIDDGLLIYENRVVAGSSAKREKTRLAAIRRAIFHDRAHAIEVKQKIMEINPENILVLGTSNEMINIICKALDLPKPSKIINIEDISTEAEINLAQRTRNLDGKHVIPVPTLEIKKDFSGFFLDPLRIFYKKGRTSEVVEEKSVVRPTYSYLGKYTISDTALNQIILYTAQSIPGIGPGGRVKVESYSGGITIKIEVAVEYGIPLRPLLEKVQDEVKKAVEYMTGIYVICVDVLAKKFVFKNES